MLSINRKYLPAEDPRANFPPDLLKKVQDLEMTGYSLAEISELIPQMCTAKGRHQEANALSQVLSNPITKSAMISSVEQKMKTKVERYEVSSLTELCVKKIVGSKIEYADRLLFFSPEVLSKFPQLKTPKVIFVERLVAILKANGSKSYDPKYSQLYSSIQRAITKLNVYNLVHRALDSFQKAYGFKNEFEKTILDVLKQCSEDNKKFINSSYTQTENKSYKK